MAQMYLKIICDDGNLIYSNFNKIVYNRDIWCWVTYNKDSERLIAGIHNIDRNELYRFVNDAQYGYICNDDLSRFVNIDTYDAIRWGGYINLVGQAIYHDMTDQSYTNNDKKQDNIVKSEKGLIIFRGMRILLGNSKHDNARFALSREEYSLFVFGNAKVFLLNSEGQTIEKIY